MNQSKPVAQNSSFAELLSHSILVDLSQPLFSSCPGWALYPPTVLEPFCEIETDGYKAERLELITHTGTHI